MKNKQELFQQAKRIVALRRQNSVMMQDERRAQIHRDCPELELTEATITACGIKAARLAASGASAEARANAMLELENAQRERVRVLEKAGYSADDLELHPFCEICKDTGVFDGKVCDCVRTLCRSLRREEMQRESSLKVCDFGSLQLQYYPSTFAEDLGEPIRDYMTAILGELQEYADCFDMHSSNLLLVGNAGLGKTHCALAIAGEALDKGYDVIYTSAQDLFYHLEKSRFDDSDTRFDAVTQADLLILDDLGTEYASPYVLSCLYNLLNSRISSRKPTIITSNIIDDEMFHQKYTEKIASRLLGNCEKVEFRGDDIRLIKHAE